MAWKWQRKLLLRSLLHPLYDGIVPGSKMRSVSVSCVQHYKGYYPEPKHADIDDRYLEESEVPADHIRTGRIKRDAHFVRLEDAVQAGSEQPLDLLRACKKRG